MKNRLMTILASLGLIMLLFLCCGCQGKNSDVPDSSRMLYFDEIFTLSEDRPVVLADVAVQKVYPQVFADEYGDEAYLIAKCSIQKAFFVSTQCPNRATLSTAGNSFLLWLKVNGLQEEYYPELQELLQQADSFIMYAEDEPSWFGRYGLDEEMARTLEQDGFNCRVVEDQMVFPPSLYINDIYMWSLIPIIDGKVDGTVVERAVEESHYAEMVYEIDREDSPRIYNGDTTEEVYQFLEEYVKEHTK